MKGATVLRTGVGLLAFLAGWVLAGLVGMHLGDYWIWLGALFGWVPAIVVANLAERFWPLVLILVAAVAWLLLAR